ncbi:hypothetical protein MASR2M15_07920 [Anaerolineales bacterium]
MSYQYPLNQLLTLGSILGEKNRPDYLSMGFQTDDIPELIRMSTDYELMAGHESDPKIWAAVHAWRVLGELGALEAVSPLLNLYHELPGSLWTPKELPLVFAQIGPRAIQVLEKYLQDEGNNAFARIKVVRSLETMARQHQQEHQRILSILAEQLTAHQQNSESLNAYLVRSLVNLDADIHLATIEDAYKHQRVDQNISKLSLDEIKHKWGAG